MSGTHHEALLTEWEAAAEQARARRELRAIPAERERVTAEHLTCGAILHAPDDAPVTIVELLAPEGARALVGDMLWEWRGRGTLRVLRRLGYVVVGREDDDVLAERVRLAMAAERARRTA